jgi:hypothetical protein
VLPGGSRGIGHMTLRFGFSAILKLMFVWSGRRGKRLTLHQANDQIK